MKRSIHFFLFAVALTMVCSCASTQKSTGQTTKISETCDIIARVISIEEQFVKEETWSTDRQQKLLMELRITDNLDIINPSKNKRTYCSAFNAGKVIEVQLIRDYDFSDPESIVKNGSLIQGKVSKFDKRYNVLSKLKVIR